MTCTIDLCRILLNRESFHHAATFAHRIPSVEVFSTPTREPTFLSLIAIAKFLFSFSIFPLFSSIPMITAPPFRFSLVLNYAKSLYWVSPLNVTVWQITPTPPKLSTRFFFLNSFAPEELRIFSSRAPAALVVRSVTVFASCPPLHRPRSPLPPLNQNL